MPKLSKAFPRALLGLLTAALFLSLPLAAQPPAHRVTGRISAQLNGAAVPGASITVKGTKNSVQSDAEGAFAINAAPNETLVITNIGFATREVRVGNSTVLNIDLAQDYSHLNDVVVVGYGKMKKTDLSSSQVTVSAEELRRTVNTTVEQALQGKAANVYVASSNAQPGAAPSVIIRGISSLSQGSQPLYVIDGVQIKPADPQGGAAGSYNAPQSYTSPLAGLNPDDVETINVLQGPSATAIFGAAGGSGGNSASAGGRFVARGATTSISFRLTTNETTRTASAITTVLRCTRRRIVPRPRFKAR